MSRSRGFDAPTEPLVDGSPVHSAFLDEPDDEPVMLDGVTSQLESFETEVDVGGGDRGALVPVEERVVLNEAFQESGRLGNRILVVAGLRPEHGCFKRPQVTDVFSSSEPLDE